MQRSAVYGTMDSDHGVGQCPGGILSLKRVTGMCGGKDPLFTLPPPPAQLSRSTQEKTPFQHFSVTQEPILTKITQHFPVFHSICLILANCQSRGGHLYFRLDIILVKGLSNTP